MCSGLTTAYAISLRSSLLLRQNCHKMVIPIPKPPVTRFYYRIFYVLEGGRYFFTRSQRTGSTYIEQSTTSRDVDRATLINVDPNDKRLVTVRTKNVTVLQIPAYAFRAFRDSILSKTRDTLFAINDTLVTLNPFIAKESWRASNYVYLAGNGYISISVPQVNEHKYSIKFFEEDGVTPLFEITNLKESPLIFDKSNFVHAGWYTFELLEDNKLKEKNKFFVPKDF